MTGVWCKGDKCLSPWSGDKNHHPATVCKITHQDNNVYAIVQYDGYSISANEEVQINSLLKSPKQDDKSQKRVPKKKTRKGDSRLEALGMFTPLSGNEEEHRLASKFSSLDKEESALIKSIRQKDEKRMKSKHKISLKSNDTTFIGTVNKSVNSPKQRASTPKSAPSVKCSALPGTDLSLKSSHPESNNKPVHDATIASVKSICQDMCGNTAKGPCAVSGRKDSTHNEPKIARANRKCRLIDDGEQPSTSGAFRHKKVQEIRPGSPCFTNELSKFSDQQAKSLPISAKQNQQSEADMILRSVDKHDPSPTSVQRRPAPRKNVRSGSITKHKKPGGFDASDLEKPCFSFPPVSPKQPFPLLSEETTNNPIEVPATINQYLRDYQRDGIQFLYKHYMKDEGAILADDMGLGKTVQVIGLIAALLHKTGNQKDVLKLRPAYIKQLSRDSLESVSDDNLTTQSTSSCTKPHAFLIIGPGSVLYNWLDELNTWGHFVARKFHGSDKAQTLAELHKGKIEIVVTTYETFRDNLDEMNRYDWSAVFVDEVHRIKILQAKTTCALRGTHTKRRFGLTGTPLQNNMAELWSILDWARPGILGTLANFTDKFVRRIERGQKLDTTKRDLAQARKLKGQFAYIRARVMLRRTKQLIQDQLPKKVDNVVMCKLTQFQTDVYKAVLEHPDMKLILQMDDPCECGRGKKRSKCCHQKNSEGVSWISLMFTYMHLLLKAANHVALLIPDERAAEQQRKHAIDVCDIAFQRHPNFVNLSKSASFRTLSNPKYCGKMKILQGLLSVYKKRQAKFLIFSYSTRLLDILEQYIISVGYEYRRLDGKTNHRRRLTIVKEFNNDPNIFICLVSTKAGGLGLNMTGANVVVIFDPNWNPSTDLQAQDRAYRIGQRRDVHVFRLISAGTIEENIYLRQVYKQQLDNIAIDTGNARRYFHGIQGDSRSKGELFGLKNMFDLRTGDTCLTMDILKRNEKLEAGLAGYDIAKYIPSSQEIECDDTQDDESVLPIEEEFPSGISDEEQDKIQDESDEEKSDDNRDIFDLFLSAPLVIEEAPPKKCIKLSSRSKVNTRGQSSKCTEQIQSPGDQKKVAKQMQDEDSGEDVVMFDQSVSGKSFASVSDVLEDGGVVHIHKNRDVIGASRAEDYMTHCALQDVYDLKVNSQMPAMHCDPYSSDGSAVEASAITKTEGRERQKKKPTPATPLSCYLLPNASKQKKIKSPQKKHFLREEFSISESDSQGCGDTIRLEKDSVPFMAHEESEMVLGTKPSLKCVNILGKQPLLMKTTRARSKHRVSPSASASSICAAKSKYTLADSVDGMMKRTNTDIDLFMDSHHVGATGGQQCEVNKADILTNMKSDVTCSVELLEAKVLITGKRKHSISHQCTSEQENTEDLLSEMGHCENMLQDENPIVTKSSVHLKHGLASPSDVKTTNVFDILDDIFYSDVKTECVSLRKPPPSAYVQRIDDTHTSTGSHKCT